MLLCLIFLCIGVLRVSIAIQDIQQMSFPLITAGNYFDDLKQTPKYRQAKYEAAESAAKSVIRQIANKPFMDQLMATFHEAGLNDAIIIAPYKKDSKNLLARTFAIKVAKTFNFEIDTDIIQQSTPKKMQQCDKFERLMAGVSFLGQVRTDKPYVIVDDNVTSGHTINALRDYIESAGGEVKYAVSLSTVDGKNIDMSISENAIHDLKSKIAQTLGCGEKHVREFFEKIGLKLSSITPQQADYLSSKEGQDRLRGLARTISETNTPNLRCH